MMYAACFYEKLRAFLYNTRHCWRKLQTFRASKDFEKFKAFCII
jgi:alpha-glucuronidase